MSSGVVVTGAARTAVRGTDGELARWHPVDLAAAVGREVLERGRCSPGDLDEVILGCADPVGACGADAARAVVLSAGWPVTVGGTVIDRAETSGLAAVQAGVAAVRSGQARTVLVLGVGLCSVVPPGAAALNRTYGAPWGGVSERFAKRGGLLPAPRLAERAAAAAGLGPAELEAVAERSLRLRTEAIRSGAIVAVAARPGDGADPAIRIGDPVSHDRLRELGAISELPPLFDEDGLLTAATFAPPADAVAGLLLRSHDVSGESALASVAGVGRAAGDPFDPCGNVAAAVRRCLADAGLKPAELHRGAIEVSIAEPDAATCLLAADALGVDPATVNRAGGALATGCAGAAEELRMLTDRLADPEHGSEPLLALSAGPVGSAAILLGLGDAGRSI